MHCSVNKNNKRSFLCWQTMSHAPNLRIAVNTNQDGHRSVNEYVMTICSCHCWKKEILTLLPGMQGVRPLVSGDSTLHGKGPQNDQQQAGNFGVHNYRYCNRK